jgi:hypothetical protein
MEEKAKGRGVRGAAMRAGMDRKTARKYLAAGKLPSELKPPRDWKTRLDPFAAHWVEIESWLHDAPALQARTLLEELQLRHPGEYRDGQVRTLQRRVRSWRAQQGPEKEVMFAQRHRPGEAGQTDFTSVAELKVTIAGQPLTHLLCVFVLPYSNWQWATNCLSESMAALRKGVQRALFRLGRVPEYHQTDHSTAATHRVPGGKGAPESDAPGKRPFNQEYLDLMGHFGMTPRTTEVGEKQQNGDVEAGHGALKNRLNQALLVRGRREFESLEEWQSFVDGVVEKANARRGARVGEDLAAMRELRVDRLPEFREEQARVSDWSTIRVKHCSYSVPSRLIGEWVRVRLYEERIEVYYADALQLACERLRGRHQCRIDYRHVIWSLVRKPGAFARYVYRAEMFPTLAFRRAYDVIATAQPSIKGDLEYLRILHLAASTSEADVATALELLLETRSTITADAVKSLTQPPRSDVPALAVPVVDLRAYNQLLTEMAS